ncbi:cell division cycle protein 27/anaphase promoting complex subunit 3 [Coprinopsis cinerea okayama7|uniref:Cell division cycle protein 27/anaphase promoting complex subunit 3 n=1 Tax=Coprinopsis cinerea (strain Okayama-7 / 130 / ATCC MYA-4618 / FGSC 9003) TaxID=240176 RepID=A8NH71_COPC7|nr:cell division cycle protein 27/anaphase promoting complex subunit 3 [Coprinopsis cinerea okayama7\|eukprot:XP_001833698.2 cell division cycle protein 27/anaphase promoting complex subunit 3 [Coprinopsis cinerea okayama7\
MLGPNANYVAQRFQSLVWACLDNDLVKSAVFYAERFYSQDPKNHDARHLYATALLAAKQTYSALHLVNVSLDEQCTGCLEIKAKCCTVLGRFRQAREALDATLQDPAYISTVRSQPINAVQTQIPRPLSSADEAGPVQKRLRSTSRQPEASSKPKSSKSTLDDPLKKARARPALSVANIISSSSHSQPVNTSRTNTALGKSNTQPSAVPPPTRRSNRLLSGNGAKQLGLPKAPTRERRRPVAHARTKSTANDVEEKDDEAVAGSEAVDSTSPPSALSPHSEGSPAPSGWTLLQEQQAQEEYEIELADHAIYELVRQFASAARRLALYDCKRCLKELERLPPAHQKSASTLVMIGKVHYELQDYSSAERAFRSAREIEPYRLWDMEVYSTLLWHLQRNIELSYLAQELLNINPQSSQAWIAIGNLFSLQKDRTQALTCFKRAAQLDPSCAYAFTLSGHETIDENLDVSTTFFESALRVDARHYNAWYGLGTCYLRASKIRRAEYHYRKALEIHPHNAVILGCVAMTLERRQEYDQALSYYNKAIEACPENALVRYRRAKMWVSMRKYNEALKDLEHLRRTTPEEANVIFQLARVYRLIGDEVKSAQALAVARDIAPKSLNKMKRLLETVVDEGDDKMDEG